MDRLVRRVFMVSAAIVMLTAIGFAARAVSSTLLKPPVPPIIAVVDLQVVVAGLDERTVKDQEYTNKGKELQASLDKKKKDLEDIKSQIEVATDPTQRDALERRGYLLQEELKIEINQAQQRLDVLYGDLLRDLYAKITDATRKIAEQNGYTMVLASDEGAEIPKGDRRDVFRAISFKRMLYVQDSHDITPEVITLMNNDFRAAGGKRVEPPAAPPAGNDSK